MNRFYKILELFWKKQDDRLLRVQIFQNFFGELQTGDIIGGILSKRQYSDGNCNSPMIWRLSLKLQFL